MKTYLPLAAFLVLVTLAGLAWQLSKFNSIGSRSGDLSAAFTSYISGVRGVQRIQLLEVSSVELIERTSEFRLFWDLIKLPDVVVQARVPVRYIYYVDLAEPFQVSKTSTGFLVHAPALKPGRPAPDVSGIAYEVKQGSLFRNPQVTMERLRKSITPLLEENATRNIPLVREQARMELQKLVEKWMKDENGQSVTVEVRFADEIPSSSH